MLLGGAEELPFGATRELLWGLPGTTRGYQGLSGGYQGLPEITSELPGATMGATRDYQQATRDYQGTTSGLLLAQALLVPNCFDRVVGWLQSKQVQRRLLPRHQASQ